MFLRLLAGAPSVCFVLALVLTSSGQDGKPEPPKPDQKPGAEAPKKDAKKGPPADLPSDPAPKGSALPRVPAGGPTAPGTPPAPLKPAVTGQPATINVQCPANATIWIEGQKMTSVGAVRSFQSPPLEAGKSFYYSFKTTWPTVTGQPDQVVEQEVQVRGGQTTVLDFRPQAPAQPNLVPSYPYTPSRPSIFRRPEGSGYRP